MISGPDRASGTTSECGASVRYSWFVVTKQPAEGSPGRVGGRPVIRDPPALVPACRASGWAGLARLARARTDDLAVHGPVRGHIEPFGGPRPQDGTRVSGVR